MIVCTTLWLYSNSVKAIKTEQVVSFYKVPLVCGAAPEIGCGSRVKPLFIETANYPLIKETWINRPGTIIAFIWNAEEPDEELSKTLFKQFSIEAKLISDPNLQKQSLESLTNKDKWYKGMEVDQLSIEEAGVIAKSTVNTILSAKLLTESEAGLIQSEIEKYFAEELVKVRSYDELKSEETEKKWKRDVFQMFVNHIGIERANKIAEFMGEKEKCEETNEKSCCDKESTNDCCTKK